MCPPKNSPSFFGNQGYTSKPFYYIPNARKSCVSNEIDQKKRPST